MKYIRLPGKQGQIKGYDEGAVPSAADFRVKFILDNPICPSILLYPQQRDEKNYVTSGWENTKSVRAMVRPNRSFTDPQSFEPRDPFQY